MFENKKIIIGAWSDNVYELILLDFFVFKFIKDKAYLDLIGYNWLKKSGIWFEGYT